MTLKSATSYSRASLSPRQGKSSRRMGGWTRMSMSYRTDRGCRGCGRMLSVSYTHLTLPTIYSV